MGPFEARLRKIIERLEYKDWTFIIGKDGIGLWFLQMRLSTPHATTDKTTEWSGRKWRMSMHMTQSEIVQTALKAILAAEEHEARERFLYKGRAIFGPHMSVERLWEMAGDEGGQEIRKPA